LIVQAIVLLRFESSRVSYLFIRGEQWGKMIDVVYLDAKGMVEEAGQKFLKS
jgi:hypothetical protein